MTPFNWAYVGNGGIAESTARQIVKGNHRIVSVYGRNPEKVKAFSEKYGAQAFGDFESAVNCNGVDGVYIATPHTAHVDYAVRAMELHKPVLCENLWVLRCRMSIRLLIPLNGQTHISAKQCGRGFPMLR